jgi:outer membrane protein TolC
MKTSVIYLNLVLFVFLLPFMAFSDSMNNRSEYLELKELIKAALDENLSLKAVDKRLDSTALSISVAGILPDPQLSLGLINLPVGTFAFDQEPMTGKVVSLKQKLPFPGKLSLAIDIARQQFLALQYQQEEFRHQIVFKIKTLYAQLYAVDRTLEVIEKNKALLRQLLRSAEIKYATGAGLQQDILQIQVELLKIEDTLLEWQEKRNLLTAEINSILNRSPRQPLKKTPVKLPPDERPWPPLNSQTLESSQPLLLAYKEKIRQLEKDIALARKNLWPDLMVGLSYNQRSRLKTGQQLPDFYSATISLEIPVFGWRKQKSIIAQKSYQLEALQKEYQQLVNELLAQAEKARLKKERYRQQIELYQHGLLLQAKQALFSAQAAYQTGKVDLQTVLNSWLKLQNYEMNYYQGWARYFAALAELEYLLGLTSLPSKATSPNKNQNRASTSSPKEEKK